MEAQCDTFVKSDTYHRVPNRITAILDAPVLVEPGTQSFYNSEALNNILIEEFPLEMAVARAPWITKATFGLHFDRGRQWKLLSCIRRRKIMAPLTFTVRCWYSCSHNRPPPQWRLVRGPVSRETCFRQVCENCRLQKCTFRLMMSWRLTR